MLCRETFPLPCKVETLHTVVKQKKPKTNRKVFLSGQKKMFYFNNLKKSFWITCVSIIRLKVQIKETKANIYYLGNVDRNYPGNFKTLKKHFLPTVTFLKVSHSLQKFLVWFICFFQLKWFCKTVLTSPVVELLCLNIFFSVTFPTKVYNISAIKWLPIVLYFFSSTL